MIIGVAGKKRVGKDTVAAYISKKYGYRHVAFADKVKDIAGDLFGLNFFNMSAEDKEKHRYIMQYIGDNLRGLDSLIWVKYVFRKYPDNIVISDVRYPNEVEYIQSQGGKVIHIIRDTGMQDMHASEVALDSFEKFDFEVYNEGTVEDLQRKVDTLHFFEK